MDMSRRLWAVVAVVGFAGCGAEDATVKPANPAPAPATPSPKVDLKAGSPASSPAPAPAVKSESSTPSPKEKTGSNEPPPLEAPNTGASADGPTVKLTDKQLANVKKLPEAEQAVAIKQAVCPVSDEPLGSMGIPIKVSAEGRSFYLCCDGCEDQVKSDPKKVLAKLDKSK